ncbi:MAG: hypothetical protein KF715_03780 [Candidatus Didemnitutus sp.]|nr:hypothetical protein [Candidatus Didemnitutus sp.]
MLRRFSRWLADCVRLVVAAFYWNTRKSAYVLRGRRTRCPCQNESDHGRGRMVGCDAVLGWNEPERFRRVCPLLFGTDEGWVCSVPATQVRPFWGRVVLGLLAVALGAYMGATLVGFTVLRVIGRVPVNYWQVALPSRWPEIRPAQAQRMLERASEAFLGGRLSEAHLALLSAQERDPSNYPASLMLAQIAMFQGSFLAADAQFARLLTRFPANADRTAVVYHDTLLSLYRLAPLVGFSLARAQADQAHAAVWVRAALLGVRGAEAAELARQKPEWEPRLKLLAPHAQTLMRAELAVRAGQLAQARALLASPYRGPHNPFYVRFQVLRCAEIGDAGAAQTLLDFYGPVLGEFEHALTQFELAATIGDDVGTAAIWQRLLKLRLDPARAERIAAALIAHPDARRFRDFSNWTRRENALAVAVDGPAMWVAGVVCGAPAEAKHWESHGRQPTLAGYPPIQRIDFTSRDILAETSALHVLNVLPLPREVILALLARVAPPEAAARVSAPQS